MANSQRLPHAVSDDDGYTVDRYIQEVPRLYPELRISYRPVSAVARSRYVDRRQQSSEEELTKQLSKVVAKQLVSWTAKDENGKSVPTTPEGVLSSHPALLNRLFQVVVWSVDGGDEDPLMSSSQSGSDDWSADDPEGDQKNS